MNLGLGLTEGPSRVLIVDDELSNRQLLEIMLGSEGLVLESCPSGSAALAAVARRPPDLILLDVMMPVLDGFTVARKLKSDPATRNIPIIMITALDDREARMRGLSAGVEDFLSKPCDRTELCLRVRNLLRLKAYGDYHDKYGQMLEDEVGSRTLDLRRERDRAQSYLDAATVILIALDREGRITLANRYACIALGWPEADLVGRDWFATCVVPHMRDEVRERFGDLLSGEVSVSEYVIRTRTGDERRIEWRNTVLRDDAGRVTGTFKSGTDITVRHQAVEALRVVEERTRFALKNANVGIWDMDYETKVIRWSDVLESQYGLEPGAFGGTLDAFLQLVHPEDRSTLPDLIGAAALSGVDFSIQNRSVLPDGTTRWLRGIGRFLLDETGKPVRGLGISEDITERRTLERQFQQAQKMEAVGQLASGVAHDFNNLLTVILGFAELLVMESVAEGPERKDLGEIIKAAQRAGGLTTQLLAFSRQQVLKAAPLDVNGLILDMVNMLGRLIGEHIRIGQSLTPKLSLAFADRGQIEQVVMNLVVNARDAMPDGGVITIETMEVELESGALRDQETVSGRYVMLAITDTGSGMTEETQRRLFEPFYTTKESGKGTGLGLSTTYGIVRQSKGYIWLGSELGRGTTFKVYLPLAENGDPASPEATDGPPAATRGSETILLVEDESSVRRLARRILEGAGYRVLEAGSGDTAEKVFRAHTGVVDLLMTDVIMPGCGGPELFTRLHPDAPGLRVLYMSGYTEQAAAQQAGIDRGLPFVQKPFTVAELLRHTREALDSSPARSPVGA